MLVCNGSAHVLAYCNMHHACIIYFKMLLVVCHLSIMHASLPHNAYHYLLYTAAALKLSCIKMSDELIELQLANSILISHQGTPRHLLASRKRSR